MLMHWKFLARGIYSFLAFVMAWTSGVGDLLSVKSAHAADIALSTPGTMVGLSQVGDLPLIQGIKFDPANPFDLQFILERNGQTSITKEEQAKLIRYFFAGLTVAEEDLWVNLSPYENNRIIDDNVEKTEIAETFLAQDYLLKQLSASLTNPDTELGEKYWNKFSIDDSRFSTESNAFSKIWISPANLSIYDAQDTILINELELKVETEADYLAARSSVGARFIASENEGLINQTPTNVLLPALTKDVNTGINFAPLRQMINSIALAQLFKKKFSDSLYSFYYDAGMLEGIDNGDPNTKDIVFNKYVEAFNKGSYNTVKKVRNADGRLVKQKYFSGGASSSIKDAKLNSVNLDQVLKNTGGQKILLSVNTKFLSIDDDRQAISSALNKKSMLNVKFDEEYGVDSRMIETIVDDITNSIFDPQLIYSNDGKMSVAVIQKAFPFFEKMHYEDNDTKNKKVKTNDKNMSPLQHTAQVSNAFYQLMALDSASFAKGRKDSLKEGAQRPTPAQFELEYINLKEINRLVAAVARIRKLCQRKTEYKRLLPLIPILHDIGKLHKMGAHPEVGARYFVGPVLEKLGFSSELINVAEFIVKKHVDLSTVVTTERTYHNYAKGWDNFEPEVKDILTVLSIADRAFGAERASKLTKNEIVQYVDIASSDYAFERRDEINNWHIKRLRNYGYEKNSQDQAAVLLYKDELENISYYMGNKLEVIDYGDAVFNVYKKNKNQFGLVSLFAKLAAVIGFYENKIKIRRNDPYYEINRLNLSKDNAQVSAIIRAFEEYNSELPIENIDLDFIINENQLSIKAKSSSALMAKKMQVEKLDKGKILVDLQNVLEGAGKHIDGFDNNFKEFFERLNEAKPFELNYIDEYDSIILNVFINETGLSVLWTTRFVHINEDNTKNGLLYYPFIEDEKQKNEIISFAYKICSRAKSVAFDEIYKMFIDMRSNVAQVSTIEYGNKFDYYNDLKVELSLDGLKVESIRDKTAAYVPNSLGKEIVKFIIPFEEVPDVIKQRACFMSISESDDKYSVGMKGRSFFAFNLIGAEFPDGRIITTANVAKLQNKEFKAVFSQQLDMYLDGQTEYVLRSAPVETMPGMVDTVFGVRTVNDFFQALNQIEASWNSKRAVAFRSKQNIRNHEGYALVLQKFVEGIPGVYSQVDPNTGENQIYGRFLSSGTGEELMTGGALGKNIHEFIAEYDSNRQLNSVGQKLSTLRSFPQEIEFIYDKVNDKIFYLQTRNMGFTPHGLIAYNESARYGDFQLVPLLAKLNRNLDGRVLFKVKKNIEPQLYAKAHASTRGAMQGILVNDLSKLEHIDKDQAVILLATVENREDILDIIFEYKKVGLVTMYGSAGSHEADLTRISGIPALINLKNAKFSNGVLHCEGFDLKLGQEVVVDASSNKIYQAPDSQVVEADTVVTDASYGINLEKFRQEIISPYLDEHGNVQAWYYNELIEENVKALLELANIVKSEENVKKMFRTNLKKHYLHQILLQAGNLRNYSIAQINNELRERYNTDKSSSSINGGVDLDGLTEGVSVSSSTTAIKLSPAEIKNVVGLTFEIVGPSKVMPLSQILSPVLAK